MEVRREKNESVSVVKVAKNFVVRLSVQLSFLFDSTSGKERGTETWSRIKKKKKKDGTFAERKKPRWLRKASCPFGLTRQIEPTPAS